MFLNPKFKVAKELTQRAKMSDANFSILKKNLELEGFGNAFIKLGGTTFVNTSTMKVFPSELCKDYKGLTYTGDVLPFSYLKNEYDLNTQDLKVLNAKQVKISGKAFYQFPKEFVNKMKRAVPMIVSSDELDGFDGFIELKKNRYFAWYYI